MRFEVKLSRHARGRVNGPVRTISQQVKAADKVKAGAVALSMHPGHGWKVVSAEPLSFLETERGKLQTNLLCAEIDYDQAKSDWFKARGEARRQHTAVAKALIDLGVKQDALVAYDKEEHDD